MKPLISKERFEERNRHVIVRDGTKQILIIGVDDKIFALDNRCPHEGYPLSKGSTNSDCVLTCNWHNWKFDLRSGKCLVGGDNVRTYATDIREGYICVDTRPPSKETVQEEIVNGLRVAFQKRQYGRTARELTRLVFNDIDPRIAIQRAISWSHDRLEFGMTHAYAACADWLVLYEDIDDRESDAQAKRISCLTEAIDHISYDALRHQHYPFPEESRPYIKEEFLRAIEREDHISAFASLNGAIASGMGVSDLEEALAEAALAHYNDFGHSLIYVQKVCFLSRCFRDATLDAQLLRCLTRSLLYTTREDLIPEFSRYAPSLAHLQNRSFGNQTKAPPLQGERVSQALRWVVETAPTHTPISIYRSLLYGNADHMTQYDMRYQEAYDRPVSQNVGWLSFTHALTFSNAVRHFAERYPHLWRPGLLQIACFYGRNSPFIDTNIDKSALDIEDLHIWKKQTRTLLFDHGSGEPIVSAHIIKTVTAVWEEGEPLHPAEQQILYRSLQRFLTSPLKRKHVRRIAKQAISLVSKDFSAD